MFSGPATPASWASGRASPSTACNVVFGKVSEVNHAASAACLLQALADSSAASKIECEKWQSQAQDSLSTIAHLQDLLAEGASWQQSTSSTAEPADPRTGTAAADDINQTDSSNLHAALQREQSRCAGLDLQVRVLSAQLVRACAAYRSAGRTLLPILVGLESKLTALRAETFAGA